MLMGVPENGTKAKMIQSPIPLTCWPCLCPNLEQELLLRMDALGQGTFGMPPFGSENGRPAQRKESAVGAKQSSDSQPRVLLPVGFLENSFFFFSER